MTAKPRIVFSTFSSSSDPMFLTYARFNQLIGGSARRSAQLLASPVVVEVATGAARTPDHAMAIEKPAVRATPRLSAGPCGVWRILASNNRELGRSALAYTSFAAARGHVLSLREAIDELTITTVSGGAAVQHGWFMSLRSVPVITCGRWYGSAASSIEASTAMRDALRVAELDPMAKAIVPPRRGHPAATDLVW